MKQSMSRVAHCIDNGPMEGFWGILKREMYYKQRFNDRSSLITAIANYIDYYNNQRLQRKLHVMTPMKYHEQYTKQHKISPAIAWLTIQKFIIFYCPLDGEHTSFPACGYFFILYQIILLCPECRISMLCHLVTCLFIFPLSALFPAAFSSSLPLLIL